MNESKAGEDNLWPGCDTAGEDFIATEVNSTPGSNNILMDTTPLKPKCSGQEGNLNKGPKGTADIR